MVRTSWVYMRVLSTWHGPVKKYVVVYVSWSNTQLHAYVARASWSCTYLLSTWYVLWIFAGNSVYVEVRFHDSAALMMKDHPYHGHSFNCSPITGLNRPAINIFYKASPSFFWVELISSRDRLPQARRAGATYHCVVASDSWVPLDCLH